MATGLAPALGMLTRTLVGRMRYLGVTGRLTDASLHELRRLEAELEMLGETARSVDRIGAVPQETQVAVARAYRRELARYGALVIADNRQARQHSATVRQIAHQATQASQRARMKRQLRVTRVRSDRVVDMEDQTDGNRC